MDGDLWNAMNERERALNDPRFVVKNYDPLGCIHALKVASDHDAVICTACGVHFDGLALRALGVWRGGPSKPSNLSDECGALAAKLKEADATRGRLEREIDGLRAALARAGRK